MIVARMLRLSTFRQLSPRDRRALVLGLAVIVPAFLVGRIAPAWAAWERQCIRAATELDATAARARAIVRESASVRDSLHARRVRLAELQELLLDGSSPNAAGAALVDAVTMAASEAGVRLGATRVEIDSSASAPLTKRVDISPQTAAVRVVRLSATLEANAAGLVAFLMWLEESPPMLRLRKLTVSQSAIPAADSPAETLGVNVVIEGVAVLPSARTEVEAP